MTITTASNGKDWQYNEYFTGTGFSKYKKDELKVPEKDSCELKHKYFIYFNSIQMKTKYIKVDSISVWNKEDHVIQINHP